MNLTRHLPKRITIPLLGKALTAIPNHLTARDFPTRHTKLANFYLKEVKLPINTLIIGSLHKHQHVLMVTQGTCLVASKEGIQTLSAPYLSIAPANSQRAIIALTDCTIVTAHKTTELDLDKLNTNLTINNMTQNTTHNTTQRTLSCHG